MKRYRNKIIWGILRFLHLAKPADKKQPTPQYVKQYFRWRMKSKEAKVLLEKLFKECNGICPQCKQPMILRRLKTHMATFDHIIPLSVIKKHTKDNLQIMCRDCNIKKGNQIL